MTAIFAMLALFTAANPTASLCKPGEVHWFDCAATTHPMDYFVHQLGDGKGAWAGPNKVLSLCGADGPDGSSVVYRFGSPGKVELVFPANDAPARSGFYAESDDASSALGFEVKDISYEVFTQKTPAELSGVWVHKAGTNGSVVECTSRPDTTQLRNLARRMAATASDKPSVDGTWHVLRRLHDIGEVTAYGGEPLPAKTLVVAKNVVTWGRARCTAKNPMPDTDTIPSVRSFVAHGGTRGDLGGLDLQAQSERCAKGRLPRPWLSIDVDCPLHDPFETVTLYPLSSSAMLMEIEGGLFCLGR